MQDGQVGLGLRPWGWWHQALRVRQPELLARLRSLYGEEPELIEQKRQALAALAEQFRSRYGSGRQMAFHRSPGRLNTLGRHIDHRGGFVNPLALSREVLSCFSPRSDALVHVDNTDQGYEPVDLDLAAAGPAQPVGSVDQWLRWTQQQTDRRIQAGTNDHWRVKLEAVPAYLRSGLCPVGELRGFDALITSDLPARAGLSSSSALVVAMLDMLATASGQELAAGHYASHAGTAEWYVGTRGGSGDHAAIKFARPGAVSHLRTVPELVLAGHSPWPSSHVILVFDSGVQADKTGRARDRFNEKTATYGIGELFLTDLLKGGRLAGGHGPVGGRLFLQDLVDSLSEAELYALVRELPERRDRRQLLRDLPHRRNELERLFATHPEPADGYTVRATVLFGLAECARSGRAASVLQAADMAAFANLVNVSHDGDRVSGISEQLRARIESLDQSLPLYMQPGAYGCSIAQIDRLVDLALAAGAPAAQILGAGLGGSVMVIAERGSEQSVTAALQRSYYHPLGQPAASFPATPVAGAGLV